MRTLVDTQILIWEVLEPDRLSPAAAAAIHSEVAAQGPLEVSVCSLVESTVSRPSADRSWKMLSERLAREPSPWRDDAAMAGLLRIEDFLRASELIGPSAQLLLRGAPLHPEGLLRNADATRRRYTFAGMPLLAISAEVTVDAWDVDAILSGPRLRTRRTYAALRI